MRLSFPSFTIGAIGIFIPIQANQEVHGLRGQVVVEDDVLHSLSTKSEYDGTVTIYMQQSQDLKSLLLRQKLNTKFFHRLKIASSSYDFALVSDEECSPHPDSFKTTSKVSLGILSRCSNPQDVCIKDLVSSVGGICALSSDDTIPMIYNDSHANHRQLLQTACTYKNGTGGGTKCQGWNACFGLDELFVDNNIGCGSCNGYGACSEITDEQRRRIQLQWGLCLPLFELE
jgi:hypothetical protein